MSTTLRWSIKTPATTVAPDALKRALKHYFGDKDSIDREVCRTDVCFMAFLLGLTVCGVDGAAELQATLDSSDYPTVVLEEKLIPPPPRRKRPAPAPPAAIRSS